MTGKLLFSTTRILTQSLTNNLTSKWYKLSSKSANFTQLD